MPAFFEIKSVSADYDRNVVRQEIFRKSFLRRPSVFSFVIDQLTAEVEDILLVALKFQYGQTAFLTLLPYNPKTRACCITVLS